MAFMLAEKRDCTGCSACYSVCSKKAIKMVPDVNTGFFYPEIDQTKCVSCGACKKICPVQQSHGDVTKNTDGYALWDVDSEKRNAGSSGGVFGRLAEEIIKRGGVVFGAAFKNGIHNLRCLSTDEIDLTSLKKSKYVECNMEDAINRMNEALKNNRWVLFCGTPCEAMGVRAYFKDRFPKLLIVDFLCHGVPSQMAYEKYIQDTERHFGSAIDSISFRSKKLGWKTYCMYIKFQGGKEYLEPGSVDPYYRMYFRNFSYRPSCYTCNRVMHSEADITLGDFWGVTKIRSFEDTDEGISLALAHTPKGIEALKEIFPNLHRKELEQSEYNYVFENREISDADNVDYRTFDYYNNDILKPLSLTERMKAFLFKHKASRCFIYRK